MKVGGPQHCNLVSIAVEEERAMAGGEKMGSSREVS